MENLSHGICVSGMSYRTVIVERLFPQALLMSPCKTRAVPSGSLKSIVQAASSGQYLAVAFVASH